MQRSSNLETKILTVQLTLIELEKQLKILKDLVNSEIPFPEINYYDSIGEEISDIQEEKFSGYLKFETPILLVYLNPGKN